MTKWGDAKITIFKKFAKFLIALATLKIIVRISQNCQNHQNCLTLQLKTLHSEMVKIDEKTSKEHTAYP